MGGAEIATSKVIESSKNLKYISFMGTGYEKHLDVGAARSKGIVVTYTPGANAYTVAEYTVALILDAVKKVTYSNNLLKSGKWELTEVWNLQRKTLGIIGMGNIGGEVARIMHNGFDMDIIYFNKTDRKDLENELKAKKLELDELLQQSDVISVNITLTPETKGLLGKAQFGLMKKGTILVNTCRAEVVDPQALKEALVSGKVATYAMDGFYKEPLKNLADDENGLLALSDNRVIITPHTAYNSTDAIKKMEEMLIESLLSFMAGKEVSNQIPR